MQEPFKSTVQIICNIIILQIICKNPVSDLKDINYSSVKATLNRCVFRMDAKCSRDDAFLISDSNLFHKVEAATINAQSKYDLSLCVFASSLTLMKQIHSVPSDNVQYIYIYIYINKLIPENLHYIFYYTP